VLLKQSYGVRKINDIVKHFKHIPLPCVLAGMAIEWKEGFNVHSPGLVFPLLILL